MGQLLRKQWLYLYAQGAWAIKKKHPAGIPVCPRGVGNKEERRRLK